MNRVGQLASSRISRAKCVNSLLVPIGRMPMKSAHKIPSAVESSMVHNADYKIVHRMAFVLLKRLAPGPDVEKHILHQIFRFGAVVGQHHRKTIERIQMRQGCRAEILVSLLGLLEW